MPNPAEGNPPPFLKGEGDDARARAGRRRTPAQHVIAHVFKVTIDPFVGKLGVLPRPPGHGARRRAAARSATRASRSRIAHLYQLQGKDHIEVTQAVPGDICAVPKIDELHFDAVLHDSHDEDHYHLKSVAFPPRDARRRDPRREARRRAEAVGGAAPPGRGGPVRARRASRGAERDRAVRARRPAPARDAAEDDRALRRRASRRARRAVPYRETISRPAEGHHRPQEADRRRRAVRRGVPAHRAARARQPGSSSSTTSSAARSRASSSRRSRKAYARS